MTGVAGAAMTHRSLIVTADDFGCSASVNSAVIRAHRDGILRFASLMVLRPEAAHAASLARENPGLGVGLHLELGAGEPERVGLRYFFERRTRAGLEGEIRAQFDAFFKLGLTPTHVDGHCNVHVHPVIFPVLCRLAREYRVPRVRLPYGELSACLSYPGASARLAPAVLAGVFSAIGGWVRSSARGVEAVRSWGLLRSGLMKEDYVLWLLTRLPAGVTEFYFHPSADERSRADDRPTPTHQSIGELEALISPRVRRRVEELGVRLVSPA